VDADDPDLVEYLSKPVEERALDVLTHVMMNLTEMPRWACDRSQLQDSTLTFPVYIACVESFFTNARLAAEFFWKMPKGDVTARTFVPGWIAPPGIAKRMERVWLLTSKHIVHLSRDRVPVDPEDWRQEDMSYGALMRITRDAYKAFALFVDAYEQQGGLHAQWLREIEQGNRPRTLKELSALRRPNRTPAPVVLEWWPEHQ
jgi:hypothetical protein